MTVVKTGKPAKSLNVQVPGQTQDAQNDPVAAPADAPATAAEKKPEARRHRDLHAHEIDPTTLTAPVLTKDGWLCPVAPEKK